MAPVGTAAPRQATERQTAATPRPAERKHTVIEAKPQSKPQAVAKTPVESKPVQPKHVESTATTAPAKRPSAKANRWPPLRANRPRRPQRQRLTAAAAAPAAKSRKTAGDVSSMKTAPSGHYTLQLQQLPLTTTTSTTGRRKRSWINMLSMKRRVTANHGTCW